MDRVMTRKFIELIHEGKYAAEVSVDLIENDTAWSPYLSPEDVRRLNAVRLACAKATSPKRQNTDAYSS
jgi:hypothetical protein